MSLRTSRCDFPQNEQDRLTCCSFFTALPPRSASPLPLQRNCAVPTPSGSYIGACDPPRKPARSGVTRYLTPSNSAGCPGLPTRRLHYVVDRPRLRRIPSWAHPTEDERPGSGAGDRLEARHQLLDILGEGPGTLGHGGGNPLDLGEFAGELAGGLGQALELEILREGRRRRLGEALGELPLDRGGRAIGIPDGVADGGVLVGAQLAALLGVRQDLHHFEGRGPLLGDGIPHLLGFVAVQEGEAAGELEGGGLPDVELLEAVGLE